MTYPDLNPRRILFITWDGPQTRYLERLFLPILAGLALHGHRVHVLQFSWAATAAEAAVGAERVALCAAAGIPYRQQAIWRRPSGLGPFLSAALGARAIRRAVADWGIDTLMPRSLMPALAVLRLRPAERAGLRIVFDADGLPADERVEFGGLAPYSATYRILRDIEAQMLRRADAVLVRTAEARDVALARAGAALTADRCHVVPNGVDPAPFAAAQRERAGRGEDGFVLGYSGSIGAQYRLPEMIDLALRLKSEMSDLRFRLLSPAQEAIRQALDGRGLSGAGWIETRTVAPPDVPGELVRCDLGLALRAPSFSMRAVAPIKIGEYLMAGVPVLGTPGIGLTAALEAEGVFRSAEGDLSGILRWISRAVHDRREEMRCAAHAAGLRHFGLEAAVARYQTALMGLPSANVGKAGDG
ncbi:glycosyltransferase [Paragemmobacter ruber]|uniref:Glycosyltransferase n=1 Tax=Paragemmobacter ruber TaxID=1985673 RepID=A0ABW9Y264_9RHOB|nr:glycosyltransferase [Rhodobacter ruber]NBE06492.1 glycosyltransferase [Rhodobacter ruber]